MSSPSFFKSTWNRYLKWYSSLNRPVILLSLTASGFLMIAGYKIALNYFTATNPLYVNGVHLFRNNHILQDVIGEPIKIKTMKALFKTKLAIAIEDKVILGVDFKGKNNSGTLTIYGLRKDKDDWILQRVEAKLRQEYYYKNFIIYRDPINDTETIFI